MSTSSGPSRQAAEKDPSAALERSCGAAAYASTPRTSDRVPPCIWALLSGLGPMLKPAHLRRCRARVLAAAYPSTPGPTCGGCPALRPPPCIWSILTSLRERECIDILSLSRDRREISEVRGNVARSVIARWRRRGRVLGGSLRGPQSSVRVGGGLRAVDDVWGVPASG
jgi:hypothetical protein